MRIGSGRLRLLAACCLMLGACETPLAPRVTSQATEEAQFLPPELAAARVAPPPAAAPPQPVDAGPVIAAAPDVPSQTGSLNRGDEPQARKPLKKLPAAARPPRVQRAAAREAPEPKSEVKRNKGAESAQPAERREPPKAAPVPADIPREEVAAVAPDVATLLPELELRKSLDAGEQASLNSETGSRPAVPGEPGLPDTSENAQPGLQPIRDPTVGAACECPYDLTPSGKACDGESEWSTPGGHDPVCYADKWAAQFGPECPRPAANGWTGDALPGFCRPG